MITTPWLEGTGKRSSQDPEWESIAEVRLPWEVTGLQSEEKYSSKVSSDLAKRSGRGRIWPLNPCWASHWLGSWGARGQEAAWGTIDSLPGERTGGKGTQWTWRGMVCWENLMMLSTLTSADVRGLLLTGSDQSVPISKINSARLQCKINATYFHLDSYRPGPELIIHSMYYDPGEKHEEGGITGSSCSFLRWPHKKLLVFCLSQTQAEKCGGTRLGLAEPRAPAQSQGSSWGGVEGCTQSGLFTANIDDLILKYSHCGR